MSITGNSPPRSTTPGPVSTTTGPSTEANSSRTLRAMTLASPLAHLTRTAHNERLGNSGRTWPARSGGPAGATEDHDEYCCFAQIRHLGAGAHQHAGERRGREGCHRPDRRGSRAPGPDVGHRTERGRL